MVCYFLCSPTPSDCLKIFCLNLAQFLLFSLSFPLLLLSCLLLSCPVFKGHKREPTRYAFLFANLHISLFFSFFLS
jgi:hypothetical protein